VVYPFWASRETYIHLGLQRVSADLLSSFWSPSAQLDIVWRDHGRETQMKRLTSLDPLMKDQFPFHEQDELLQYGILSSSFATEGGQHREELILHQLSSQLRLVNRVLNIERERLAQLAEAWGHCTFAQFLRERTKRETQLQE
jgi:hypothetical protein